MIKDRWCDILHGAFFGLVMVAIVILLVAPDNREISVDDYHWLMEQMELYPEIRPLISEKLSGRDDAISHWELWRLKRAIRRYARQALSERLISDGLRK